MMNERIIVEKPLNQRVKKISYKVFVISFIAIVLLITYTPILVMGITSFSTDPFGYRFTGFTFSWYSKLFTNGELNESIMFTLQITFLSTLISTIFGTITAIGINVLNRNAKKKIIVLNNVPILNADIVTAVFLLLVFQIISIIIGAVLCSFVYWLINYWVIILIVLSIILISLILLIIYIKKRKEKVGEHVITNS